MAKIDRRIHRTRRHLGEALLSLIEEKSYHAVTIRDITERADIAYATFFRHYESKNALLMEQLEKLLQEIEANASSHQDNYFAYEGQLLFEHVQANVALYRNLLTDIEVLQSLKPMIMHNIKPHFTKIYQQYDKPKLPVELLLNHSVTSLLGLISWWLEHDMPYPVEEMATYYQLLVIESGWRVLGNTETGHDSIVSRRFSD